MRNPKDIGLDIIDLVLNFGTPGRSGHPDSSSCSIEWRTVSFSFTPAAEYQISVSVCSRKEHIQCQLHLTVHLIFAFFDLSQTTYSKTSGHDAGRPLRMRLSSKNRSTTPYLSIDFTWTVTPQRLATASRSSLLSSVSTPRLQYVSRLSR